VFTQEGWRKQEFFRSLLDPFLGKPGKVIYNWVFIAAIVADSIWLILSWVWKCAPLVAAMESGKFRKAA
jgi:hypothetical protein